MPTLDIHSPLQAAVDQMAARVVVGSPRTAAQWALLPAELRLRYMFSARVEHERTLAEMQARITDALAGRKREGVTMDKGRFVEEMREIVRATGYKRPEGTHRKSIRNLKSRARLELIWEMNRAQAIGYAKWLKDMDPDLLEASPCYELVRVMARQEPRVWPAIWKTAGGEFNRGRMIAKKTDPIWVRISRFGTPWPPFDWGSGMGLRGVRRAEAEKLGAVSPDDEPQRPQAKPFNEEHSASANGIPEKRIQAILEDFAGVVEYKDGRLRLAPQDYDPGIGKWFGFKKRNKPEKRASDTADRPPPKPDGSPVGAKLTVAIAQDIKNASRIEADVRHAISLVDSVHGDGVLPDLGVLVRVFDGRLAQFVDYDGLYLPVPKAAAPEMLLNETSISYVFSTLHEIGHFLDNLGFHTPSRLRPYASEGQPGMEPLMTAILSSHAVRSLLVSVGSGHELVSKPEIFARAYAQFVAVESGDRDLLKLILAIRKGDYDATGTVRDIVWFPQDFAPIRREMRALFIRAGWPVKR